MYKILFVYALHIEGKYIKSQIEKIKINKLKIDFFCGGMGNYNMILNLTKYLVSNKYDILVNIGSCGYTLKRPKNIYQVYRIINLSNKKEFLVPINFKVYDLITCLSAEKPVSKLKKENILIDMESFGFEMVANDFKLPRLILKIPVDKIGSVFDKNIFVKRLNKIDFEYLIQKIIDYLNTIPNNNIDKYINHFKFTFSQKFIFKNLYYKYLSILNNDFEKFFQLNKNLSKKDFLKKLKDRLS